MQLPVHGAITTVELDRYAVIDKPATYKEGQHLPMLVAPKVRSESDIIIADTASRDRLIGAVRSDITWTIVGGVMFVIGAPFLYRNVRLGMKRKRHR